jgi:DNA-binding IclR family transcriptional regulator
MIGSEVPHRPGMQELARQVMEDLSAATHSTVRLGVLDRLQVTYLEKRPHTAQTAGAQGAATAPLHATAMGKALLAFTSQDIVERVIAAGLARHTPFTLTAPEQLRHALGTIRLTHVASSRREFDLETAAVAVPVFGVTLGGSRTIRTVVAALEIQARDPQTDLRALQPAVTVAARSLTRELVTSRTHVLLAINAGHRITR